MRIKFIGHEYHQKTVSAHFFAEILKTLGTVDLFWDNSCDGGEPVDLSDARDYDMVVVWQVEIPALRAAQMGLKNFVFVPMYDGAKHLTPRDWWKLGAAKVINFSSFLHEHTQRMGVEHAAFFQYFLDPSKFKQVSDFSKLRPLFWQRIMTLPWQKVLKLLGEAPVDAFHLHYALDPSEIQKYDLDILNDADRLPGEKFVERYNIKVTRWFENREERMQLFEKSNLLFAPRLDEGIGTVLLEGLALGMPVVAHNAPTMNEYVIDGVNGFLYNAHQSEQLALPGLKKLSEMGRRARETAEIGYERWMMDRQRLLDFCVTPKEELSKGRFSFSADMGSLPAPEVPADARNLFKKERGASAPKDPLLTVAIVTFNAQKELLYSLPPIFSQDLKKRDGSRDFEIIVVDGASKDGTVDVLRGLGDRVDYWVCEKDKGIFDAMNKAAKLARGKYIIYANAGDVLCDSSALRHLLEGAPEDADLVVAHHIYKTLPGPQGVEEIHQVRDFENSWKELLEGKMPSDWERGIPCHQSMATRTELLQKHPFDAENYPIAADHEFYDRMKSQGKKFHTSPAIVCCYHGGGNSAVKELGCLEEWRSMARRFTRRRDKVDAFYAPMIRNCVFKGLSQKKLKDLWEIFPRHPFTVSQAFIEKFLMWLETKRKVNIRLDFRRCHEPDFNAKVSGFTYAESSWGTWTDGKVATVLLPKSVSGRVLVRLVCAFIYKPTLINGFSVALGGQTPVRSSRLRLSLIEKKSKVSLAGSAKPAPTAPQKPSYKKIPISFLFELKEPTDSLVFRFSDPKSPHELSKSSNDHRKLGFGIQALIVKNLDRPKPTKAAAASKPAAVQNPATATETETV